MKKFFLNLLESLKWLIADKEMIELYRWRTEWEDYRRWLSEFPEVAITLDNFKNKVNGSVSMDACHPPGISGPWTVEALREHLRAMSKLQTNDHISEALKGLISHYCYLIDNIGDTPIPDFENWAIEQYKKGNDILNKRYYLCDKFYFITIRENKKHHDH